MEAIRSFKSPIGFICAKSKNNIIIDISILDKDIKNFKNINFEEEIDKCIDQLHEYFKGKRKHFEFKFKNETTDFRQKVYEKLIEIPYGKTVSYKELAIAVNNEKAVRAVGGANHNNNIAIVVPCHRVIGSNGKLVGYAGGLWRKEWLLNHEKQYV